MQHHIYNLNSFDGTRLFVQLWQPDGNAKAVICLVHGIGEHSSRYLKWAEKFVAENYAVISFDQRGHGLSSGKRGVIPSYQAFMSDIDLILAETKKQFPKTHVFLYGHSMGGGEVLNHMLSGNSNCHGAISTSPWIVTQVAPNKFLVPLVRILNKILPSVSFKTSFDSNMLSHDIEVARKYEDDELVHHMVSSRLFLEAYDVGRKILNESHKLKKPLLLMHGSEDQITDPMASKSFAEKNKEYCTFKMWNGGYHELHHETFKADVFGFIINWLDHTICTMVNNAKLDNS